MLVKYIAVDLNYYGLNKHVFLSDDYWTNDEKMATLYNCPVYAYNRAKDEGAIEPNYIKVHLK